jgi:segregation and condensation protein A
MEFVVDLKNYRGPLELLLYLVRRHEIEVTTIPIAAMAEQYIVFLSAAVDASMDDVGDFIDLTSTLVEIKSRVALPRDPVDEPEEEQTKEEIVARLLQYKQFRDAAYALVERAAVWQDRFAREADDQLPRPKQKRSEEEIVGLELWDLVSAMGRIRREQDTDQAATILYDDTPIQSYMLQINKLLSLEGKIAFSELFSPGMHKSAVVGIFLAVLELARHHSVRAEQESDTSEIWLLPGEEFSASATAEQLVGGLEAEMDEKNDSVESETALAEESAADEK